MSGPEGTGREGDEPIEADSGNPAEEAEELSLVDEEEPLPWLESGDIDDRDEGVDTGRIVGFVLIAALALLGLFGAIWFFSDRSSDAELIADGSTIEAPAGPVKEKPEDPGGRNFAGTGDVAPAVGEGQTREGRIADKIIPKPNIAVKEPDPAKAEAAAAQATSSATAKATASAASQASGTASSGGVAVQVGAYSNKAGAEKGWNALNRQTEALKGVKYRIVEGQADIGTVFRLQAVAGDRATAKSLCGKLRADGLACQVK